MTRGIGDGSPADEEHGDDTNRQPLFDAAELEDDAGPEPGGSLARTGRRPLLEPEDALELELTLETRALDHGNQSADDSFHQMTIERVRALSQPGDSLSEALRPVVEEDEPPPLGSAPSVPKFSAEELELDQPTTLDRPRKTEDRPLAEAVEAERALLAAIAAGDDGSRLVYADWLARRGEVARAELLRLDDALAAMAPTDERFAPTQSRLRELAPRIGLDWRSRVSRAAIEGCVAVACPGRWRALPDGRDVVRACPTCAASVHFCARIEDARARIAQGQRVAIDVACPRAPGDLGPQCASCGGHFPAETRFCPHCGRPQQRS